MNKALGRNLAYSQCSINGGFLPLPKSTARISPTGGAWSDWDFWWVQGSAKRASWRLQGGVQGGVDTDHQGTVRTFLFT